jgi:starch-binding outer membrane protein, SusD/RagB family
MAMKKYIYKIRIGVLTLMVASLTLSCHDDLLNQQPTIDMGADAFWKTVEDATFALNGAYADTRGIFARDYLFDGHGEFSLSRNETETSDKTLLSGKAYHKGNYTPQGYGASFDNYYEAAYGAIHRCNYVIQNVEPMLEKYPANRTDLEIVIGEARLLRGMTYFRLISMYGDVVYLDRVITGNEEVENIKRSNIRDVKQKIEADFTYAYEKLPDEAKQLGRSSKWAGLAFRGKLHLYWACWNRTSWPWTSEGGWPELDGFTPNQQESDKSYLAAKNDFGTLIDESGLALYRNGAPGQISPMGSFDNIPSYFNLFIPKFGNAENINKGEIIMSFTHGGTGTGQGESLMRNFGNRATESSQIWIQPYSETVNRYQSTITGDFVTPIEYFNPGSDAAARTRPNSAINPATYADRDYRLKASMLWDGEVMMGLSNLLEVGFRRFQYKKTSGTINGIAAINSSQAATGLIPRKFVRNYGGQWRVDGDYSWPVMRLADVYLMYAEASNEVDGPTQKAIDLVDQIRGRGNLPKLAATKYANKDAFFDAIEQERIVELLHEGYRGFDIRRWRMMTKVWGPVQGPGVKFFDTWGVQKYHVFNNANDLVYQRQYIFRIPPGERNLNPNLTQNKPWL